MQHITTPRRIARLAAASVVAVAGLLAASSSATAHSTYDTSGPQPAHHAEASFKLPLQATFTLRNAGSGKSEQVKLSGEMRGRANIPPTSGGDAIALAELHLSGDSENWGHVEVRLSGDFDATGTWTPNALDPGTFSSTLTVKLEIDLEGDHHQQLVTAKALKLTATDLSSFPPNGARWEGHQSVNLVTEPTAAPPRASGESSSTSSRA